MITLSSDLTERLREEGASIHYEENVSLIPASCQDREHTLVIYTPAIPATHLELAFFRAEGYEIMKRAQVLGMLTRSLRGLCVAGTHGKTTTSSMVAHMLHQSHVDCFRHYTTLIQPGGYLILHTGLKMQAATPEGVTTYTYSQDSGDFHAADIRIGGGEIVFDLISPLGNISDIRLGVPVMVNIENGIAAMALAQIAGLTPEEIRTAMASFRGVDRRFDFRVKTKEMVYLSDYAHHPTEIRQSLLSIKALYEGRHIKVIFQPHLYTRTRDFYREFADALSLVDDVVIVDIYPAREEPIPGVTSRLIYDNLRPGIARRMCHKEEICDIVREGGFDVLVTLGAGDIENYAKDITAILSPE